VIRPIDYAILGMGVGAVSFAAVLIRGAEAPALVIAAYRMALAGSLVGGLAAALKLRNGTASRPGRHQWVPLASGGFLALHFGFWIAAVQQTSVITAVVLVTTTPLFVAAASPWVLRESPGRAVWGGIAVAAAGALLMVAEDVGEGAGTLLGDFYALLGSAFAAAYLMAGRWARPGGSWLGYIGTVYPVAAVLLLLSVFIVRESLTGYDGKTYLMFVLLAAGPQLVGHSSLNWVLGHVPVILVSTAILAEPVGATALAAFILRETPTGLELLGALLVLFGVYLALRPGRAAATQPEPVG
jgi:drug/metabolite transporter (DMT)-like permease